VVALVQVPLVASHGSYLLWIGSYRNSGSYTRPWVPVAMLPMSRGFQLAGGVYAVPLVYSVSFRGNALKAAELAGVELDELGGVELVLHALASASTKLAAAPAVAHRTTAPLLALLAGVTFVLLLTWS